MSKKRENDISTASPAKGSRVSSSRRSGKVGNSNYIFWVAAFGVCIIVISAIINSGFSVPLDCSRDAQASYVLSEPAGLHDFCEFLTNPDDPKMVFEYLKLIDKLNNDSPDFKAELLACLPEQQDDVCLVSFALCMLGYPEGIPQFIDILKESDVGQSKYRKRNFFSSEYLEINRYIYRKCSDDDVVWAIQTIQDTLDHTFVGNDWVERKQDVLEWWEKNSEETFFDWQKAFLKSDNPYSRSEAFKALDRLKIYHCGVLQMLEDAMKNEIVVSLKHHMACNLFAQGRPASVPIFNDYVQQARSPEDIANILAIASLHCSLPREFREADSWRNGARDDAKSFKIFIEWWNTYWEMLVHNGLVWEPKLQETEANPFEAVVKTPKPDSPKTSPVKTPFEVEKGPFD